jgi:hypothetical protein
MGMRRGTFAPFVAVSALAAVVLSGCSDSTGGHPVDPSSAVVSAPAGRSSDPISPAPTAATAATAVGMGSPGTGSVGTGSTPSGGVPTVPADVPTTGPNLRYKGERPPVMPVLATRHTQAGAVAFAKFFELTIDWGYATTSTAYMKHYYEPSCVTCKSIQIGLDKAASQKHHFIGGRMTITRAVSRPVGNDGAAERSALVAYALTSIEVVDRHGTFVDADPAVTLKDQIWTKWLPGAGWVVVHIGPVV